MKVAVINLLPETGHVVPLLRIANNLKLEGMSAKYFGVEEMRKLVLEDYEMEYESLGEVRPSNYKSVLSRFAGASFCFREIFIQGWFYFNYSEVLTLNASKKYEKLKNAVLAYSPDIILADNHHFLGLYKKLAKDLHLPLVINNSCGSNYLYRPKNKILIYFLKKLNIAVDKIVWCYKFFFNFKKYKNDKLIKKQVGAYWHWLYRENLKDVETLNISLGIGVLENIYLKRKVEMRKDFIQLGPQAIDISSQKLTSTLSDWLDDESSAPIIYVGFGTMIKGGFSWSHKILMAADHLGFRVLWAHPEKPWADSFVSELSHRWEPWVQQTKILSHPRVMLFINHAGAGACQEAMWFGKPSVCIPFIWDQHYNSWVLEQLGCAVRLTQVKKMKQDEFNKKLLTALNLNLKEKSDKFRSLESTQKILDLIVNYVAEFRSSATRQTSK